MKEHIGSLDKFLDFCNSEYGNKELRNDLTNIRFEYVDFTESNFENCNLTNVHFINCDFLNCNFSEVRQWNCIYINCKFEKTTFYNSQIGIDNKYTNCQFVKAKLYGREFSFGRNSEFNKCNFENCNIKSTWILSTKFIECTFTSKFINVRFSGALEAKVSTSKSNIEFPATFINCDLTNSKFEQLEIMDGVILTETKLPEQHMERINNDRNYYPKK